MELFPGTEQMGVGARGVLHISESYARSKLSVRPWVTKEGAKKEGKAPVCQAACDRDWDGDRAPAGPVEETAKGSRTASQQEIKLPCLCWLEALTHFSSARPNTEGKRRP